MTRRINLIGDDSGGAGLSRDLELLSRALVRAGYAVTVTPTVHPKGRLIDSLRARGRRLARAWRRTLPFARHDAAVMLERLHPRLLGTARRTFFVPNAEWYGEDPEALAAVDLILAKTEAAAAAFGGFGRPVAQVGFTSADRLDRRVERRPDFLHLPGKSPLKGTLPLLQLWAENPEWPRLTVVYRLLKAADLPAAANIAVLDARLDEAELLRQQNAHAFHLCPSATEGYGHYIGEAMSVGAVTVTLDAPPMNELVRPDRGLLLPAQPVGQQNLATLYGYRPDDLRAAVERCIAMPPAEREALGGNARRWFEANLAGFERRLAAAVAAAL